MTTHVNTEGQRRALLSLHTGSQISLFLWKPESCVWEMKNALEYHFAVGVLVVWCVLLREASLLSSEIAGTELNNAEAKPGIH